MAGACLVEAVVVLVNSMPARLRCAAFRWRRMSVIERLGLASSAEVYLSEEVVRVGSLLVRGVVD